MAADADLRHLLEIEEIKRLKARYFRLMDTKQFDAMRALFVDDVRISGLSEAVAEGLVHDERGPRVFNDVDAFLDALRAEGPEFRCVHHGHMPEIELTSATTATGTWSMFEHLEWPLSWARDHGLPLEQYGMTGCGFYSEEYVKENGTWRIARLHLTRLRVDPLVRAAPPAGNT